MISERRVYLIGILTGRQEFILHTAVFTSLYTWIDKTRSWSSKSILCVIKVSTADHANNDKGNRNCRSCCHTYINRLGYFNESLSIKLNLKKNEYKDPYLVDNNDFHFQHRLLDSSNIHTLVHTGPPSYLII